MSTAAPRAAAPWLVVAAMACVYLVWGSTYLAIRVSVDTVPPLLAASLRFLLSAIVLTTVLRATGRFAAVTRGELQGAALLGVWILVGGVGVITLAETHVPSNVAAVIASSAAVWVATYRLGSGERPRLLELAAVVAGLVGIAILLLTRGGGDLEIGWLLLALLASLLWSSGSFYGRRLTTPTDPFTATAIEMAAAGLVLGLAGLVAGEAGDVHLDAISAGSTAAIAYLVGAGTVALVAYIWLLDTLPIGTVVTHQYVNPLVAVALGWLILDEPITTTMLLGAALVIGAVVLIVQAQRTSA